MNVQITNSMFMAVIINLMYTKAIGLTQGIMARKVGNDIWVSTIFAIVQGAIVMLLTVWAVRRASKTNLVEQTKVLLGTWGAWMVSGIVLIFFVGAYATVLVTLVYHLMDYFLPEVPLYIFVFAAVIIPLYAVFHGLEVTGRIAIFGVFSVIALNLLLLVGSMHEIHISGLMPVFVSGVWKTVSVSRYNDTDWAMATMMTAILLPFVKDTQTWTKSGLMGVFYGGILVLMWPILECGTLSAQETAHYVLGCMQMARGAQIGLFIHRYEMIMIAFFGISLLVQLTAMILCGSLAVSQSLGIKNYRQTVIPVGLMMGGFGYWIVADHNRAMRFLENYWPEIALPIAVGLPVCILLLGAIFRRKLTGANAKA